MEDYKKEKVMVEIWSKTCPECGKVFTSQTKAQLDWNFQIHHDSCKRKQNKKEKKKK